ncbi:glycosyltransferase family 2 protein [Clostridium perfringens]|nr:glycosyltransferase family 2 protein [Clostridium perfringens]
MKPLVSVIIPVYNVQQYIEKCLNSVLEQSYNNIEVIIVNDGSTDNSLSIINNIISNKENVKLIVQKNKGLSSARNSGLKFSKGKYIFLLDSDDYIQKDVIDKMVNKAEKDDSDIVIGKYNIIESSNKKNKESTQFLDESIILNNIRALEELFLSNKFHFHAWGKLYKKSLFADIEYPVGRYYEDIATTYKLIYKSQRISFVNISTCEYIMRKDSICHQEFKDKHLDFIKNIDEMEYFLKEKNIYNNLEKEFNFMKLRNYIYLGFYKVAISNVREKGKILNLLRDKILDILNDNNIKLNSRESFYKFLIRKNLGLYMKFAILEEYIKRRIK